jgi:2-oxoglutarate ferredoxin oxidoreductase subunit alpha
MAEAFDALQEQGVHIDTLRVRAFPFSAAVDRFVAEHESVFVVEQNRDAQLRMMLINEQEIARPSSSRSCTTTARRSRALHHRGDRQRVRADNVEPIRAKKKGKAAA